MGCHFLLQGSLPYQGSNPSLLNLCIGDRILLPLCNLGSPSELRKTRKNVNKGRRAFICKGTNYNQHHMGQKAREPSITKINIGKNTVSGCLAQQCVLT